MAKKHYRPR